MKIGERIVEGEVREKEQAKKTYAQAKTEGRRAALLEQERPNIFTSSVANIAPGEEIRVEIEYQQTLRYDQGRYSLRFPMVVGPRYLPARHGRRGRGAHQPRRCCAPTSRRRSHNPVTLRVEVQAGVPIDGLRSSSHTIDAGACGRSALPKPCCAGRCRPTRTSCSTGRSRPAPRRPRRRSPRKRARATTGC